MSISTPSVDSRIIPTTSENRLDEGDIHSILSNERRREVLKHLRSHGGESTLRDLSEAIAEAETGESPPPRNIRDSVYASLHQTHLPMLDKLGVINYESNLKTVTLTERSRDLVPYTTVMSSTGLAWYQHYLLIGLVAMVTVFAAEVGFPVIDMLGTAVWAGLFTIVLVASFVVQLSAGTAPLARVGRFLRDFRTS
ncbi:DUF7344 domain-containing protein [Haloarchaeobius sp. TZWSO28]|uniref:DUF7344 domain-containing protein n=1 Tax=Haloarchaeobius sp. TZWSO28 TaxID=3446119 RepID=UPI003EC03142